VSLPRSCPAGHELSPGQVARRCAACRRDLVTTRVAEADPSLAPEQISAAVGATLVNPAVLRDLAAALADGPGALRAGAPASVGRLVAELRERGSQLPEPRCAACGRTDRPLYRSGDRGVCPRCRSYELAEACAGCGERRPVISRGPDGSPRCWRCSERPRRRCGICGQEGPIAKRAKDGEPDICNRCFEPPVATCTSCGRRKPCYFVVAGRPVCASCSPRRTEPCAHCGAERPPCARWPEGPVCEPCYRAALGRRGSCAGCGEERRLVFPPGLAAKLCCDCAGVPPLARCRDCGVEERLYKHGRCARCALAAGEGAAHRAGRLHEPAPRARLRGPPRCAPALQRLELVAEREGAVVLADMAANKLALSHEALDAHPRRAAAEYLRQVLVANGALPGRNEHVARLERWVRDRVTGIERPEHRRMVHTYATWVVLRRLRHRADAGEVVHSRLAKTRVNAAVHLLSWLAERGQGLADLDQGLLERFLEASCPSDCEMGDFLSWAARHRYTTGALEVPRRRREEGEALDDDARWEIARRLLHDEALELTDRVAGCLVLLYGQQLSRIVAIRTDQVVTGGEEVQLRLGRDCLPLPEPLGGLVTRLAEGGRRYVGVGTPANVPWLFPGLLPGKPLNAQHLGQRLRAIGIDPRPGRRSAMVHLAARMPAAVLADMVNLHPTTAVHWARAAGGDWSTYAALIARDHDREGY
jgi:predicted Zn-ribbon and HTH transcriptional regulator